MTCVGAEIYSLRKVEVGEYGHGVAKATTILLAYNQETLPAHPLKETSDLVPPEQNKGWGFC